MNNFDSEDRDHDRDRGRGRRDGPRGRGGGGGDFDFGYKDNGQGFRTRRPPRGMGNFGRTDRPFRDQRRDLGMGGPQFGQYGNSEVPREGFFEGRGRGWNRGQRYSRGGGGGGYRNRNPQDSYYNDGRFQGGNRLYQDAGMEYAPGQDGRRRQRQNGGMRRYNSNENENIGGGRDFNGYERKRYGDDVGRYRRGGRGRGGQMRNNNNGFGRPYNNRGGQRRGGNRRYPNNSRRGQRRGQRGGHQRSGRQEERKVPFLNETLQPVSDVKSDTDDNKKEKPETVIPNTGQYTLHYWDAPVMENLPPLDEK